MPWTKLNDRLNNLPSVLAGPVLRKVTANSVTVWLALRKPGTVTLAVIDPNASASTNPIMSGTRHSVAIGTNLHIVAVTAQDQSPDPKLTSGVIYHYSLGFLFDSGLAQTLATATDGASLAYAPHPLPSFCLPPAEINDLRLLFGSCRIPHGEGPDAFALGNGLIAQTCQDPTTRPHQLLLTGDQIYADDVAPAMLMMLSDAAKTLLGWNEILPVNNQHGGPATVDRLPPYYRKAVLEDAGFTSEDLDAHLMSLGEYLCMYLFVWSDTLWGGDPLPSFEDLLAAGRAGISDHVAYMLWSADRLRHQDAKKHDANLKDHHVARIRRFREALPDVRRMLANIPSYMILDDHEVTDDWNMTRDFCKNVYGNDLGLRIIQNGLAAYALCQHWGNVPEQFDRFGQPGAEPPGETLLGLLSAGTADAYDANGPAIRSLLAVHDDATLLGRPNNSLFHDANSLTYNYTVEGTKHQIIFVDARTWRSFPAGDDGSVHVPSEQLHQQIVATHSIPDRVVLVVLPTNAPAVQQIRSARTLALVANLFEHYPDVYEAWELPSVPFDRLMTALTSKLPVIAGQRTGSVILLSGDVHFSFATRLLYKATARFEETEPNPTKAVIAQLVGSSYRKQTNNTLGFHREGYNYAPVELHTLKKVMISIVNKFATTEGYVGWNQTPDSDTAVGQRGLIRGPFVPLLTVELVEPTVKVSPDGYFFGVAINSSMPPDYSMRLDYLRPTKDGIPPASPPPIPPLPAGATAEQRQQAAAAFNLATGQYRVYNADSNATSKIIGVNNFCEITFDWHPTDIHKRKVNHTTRWRISETDPVQFTNYVVSLDPDDADFPEITPRAMS